MLHAGDSVLVGVSGGPDSVALLHALLNLAGRFSLRLGVAHLNHCLRGGCSDRDADFVAALARKLNLPCFIEKQNVGEYQRQNKLSLEEAARLIRYAFLEKIAEQKRYAKIALGHHADDNAELILMYLLRGSGLLGLSGIPPVRDGKFIRPMIRTTRAEILDFLALQEAGYVCDASNDDTRFMRNRIRRNLIPVLKNDYNPKIIEALNRLGAIAESEEEWTREIITSLFEKLVISRSDEMLILSAGELNTHHLAAKRRLVRKAIETVKGDLRRITLSHIDSVIAHLAGNGDGKSLDLPDRIRISLKNGNVYIVREKKALRTVRVKTVEEAPLVFEYRVVGIGVEPEPVICRIAETGMMLKFSQTGPLVFTDIHQAGHRFAFFDMDKLSFPLIVRNFRPGDRFVPLGLRGSQKVKNFFINRKVPRSKRNKCPILLSQDKIIWIAGYEIDDTVKVESSSRNILKVELLLA